MAADGHQRMWRLLDVKHFVPFGFAWVADQAIAPTSFSGGALLVAMLALFDREELGDDRAKCLET